MNITLFHLKKRTSGRVLLAAIVAMLAMVLLVSPVAAASPPVSGAHILVHLDLASGQQPENITLEPDGSADVSFPFARQIARITLQGQVQVLATLPVPAGGSFTPLLGVPILTGIVRTSDGTLYFAYSTGTADLTGIWSLQPGGVPQLFASLPTNSLANGLALDEQAGMLYAADSVLSMVWRIPLGGGTPLAWASGPDLAPINVLGANGIKVHHQAVWVTNTDAATLVRIPIRGDGSAGPSEIKATSLNFVDDFAFIGESDLVLAAFNRSSQLALVKPDGTITIVLTSADGISNPSSVAVRGKTIYVANAAYTTKVDPNLLLASL